MIKQAIQLAIEGGYEPECRVWNVENLPDRKEDLSHILISPAFWQSLGKALGWGHIYCVRCKKLGEHKEKEDKTLFPWKKCCERQKMDYYKSYSVHWHRFIDHLSEGKDADDFFKKLLNKNQ